MVHTVLNLFSVFFFLTSRVIAQQGYSGNSVLDCNNYDDAGSSPAFLYTCNGQKTSCQAFLIFRSQPPYNSVITISELASSDPAELARLNNVSRSTVFPTDREVIIPVNCSCSGEYYQANSTYVIPSGDDTYSTIANDTYQGLSTCNSLINANDYNEEELSPGLVLRIPQRCACPTRNQVSNGTKYLLTYSVYWDDSVSDLSYRFNASEKSVLDANVFSEYDPTLFPFTTLLIPLLTEPSSLQTTTHTSTSTQPKVVPSYPSSLRIHKSNKGLYVSIVIAGSSSVLVLLCVLLAFFLFLHKGNQGATKGKKTWVLPEDLLVGIATAERVLKVFAFEELREATNNFNSDSKMKGYAHRGLLRGEVVVIKRMNKNVWKEVRILNKINHFNLIRLHGVCKDNGNFYLVYEYMAKGCLKDWFCSKSCPLVQSWLQRVQIALDVANGLHYIHNFTEPAYIHKNIKSSNVLLSSDLRAKIANFGLASSVDRKDREFASSKFMGTRGYMAPEYLETGSVTPKIDIYAFGVVMLELLTGRNVIMLCEGKELFLSTAITLVMEGETAEVELCNYMDPILGENYPRDLALAVAKLSVACLMRDPESRPSMDELVSTLVRINIDSLKWESSYVKLV